MTEEVLFIKIDEPKEFRKALLLSIRELIHSLQRHDTVKKIRTEKVEQIIKLKNLAKETDTLLGRIKNDLPNLTAKETKKNTKAAKGKESKTKAKSPAKKQVLDEMTKLETQLKDIESKLKGM